MAGDLRREWQDFKKKHPYFEKSNNFKADLGPELEKYDKALSEFRELWGALKKKAHDIMGAGTRVEAAVKHYAVVIDALAKLDHAIKADFSNLGITHMDRLPKEVNQVL